MLAALPFNPILFRFNDAIDSRNSSSECLFPVSTPDTSICSHSMGTFSALKMVLTDSATSAPMPSPSPLGSVNEEQTGDQDKAKAIEEVFIPGMRDTVYFPPNFVGLKMSDCTVAIAGEGISHCRLLLYWSVG